MPVQRHASSSNIAVHSVSLEAIQAAAEAAAEGSGPAVAELRRLLECGPVDWSQGGRRGKGALFSTIEGGGKGKRSFAGKGQGKGDSESNVEAVQLLLEHNADPNEVMEDGGPDEGVTGTMMAIIMGQEGALEALLEAKADVEANILPRDWGGPLLQLAAGGLGAASPEMTKILLQQKADIHAIDNGGGKGKAGGMKGKGTARPKTAGKHGGNCLIVRLSGYVFEVLVCQAMVTQLWTTHWQGRNTCGRTHKTGSGGTTHWRQIKMASWRHSMR